MRVTVTTSGTGETADVGSGPAGRGTGGANLTGVAERTETPHLARGTGISGRAAALQSYISRLVGRIRPSAADHGAATGRKITLVLASLVVVTVAASTVLMAAGSDRLRSAPLAGTTPFLKSPGSAPVVVPDRHPIRHAGADDSTAGGRDRTVTAPRRPGRHLGAYRSHHGKARAEAARAWPVRHRDAAPGRAHGPGRGPDRHATVPAGRHRESDQLPGPAGDRVTVRPGPDGTTIVQAGAVTLVLARVGATVPIRYGPFAPHRHLVSVRDLLPASVRRHAGAVSVRHTEAWHGPVSVRSAARRGSAASTGHGVRHSAGPSGAPDRSAARTSTSGPATPSVLSAAARTDPAGSAGPRDADRSAGGRTLLRSAASGAERYAATAPRYGSADAGSGATSEPGSPSGSAPSARSAGAASETGSAGAAPDSEPVGAASQDGSAGATAQGGSAPQGGSVAQGGSAPEAASDNAAGSGAGAGSDTAAGDGTAGHAGAVPGSGGVTGTGGSASGGADRYGEPARTSGGGY